MAIGDTVHGAHSDNVNQVYSMLGVIGTLGTADTKGSANTLPIGVNPDTGAMYVDVMDTQFNVGTLSVGTINKVGTVSEITSGTVSINTPGTITSGTITSVGTVVGVGVVSNLTNGSIKVTAGTVDITPLGGVVLSGTVGG